MMKYLGLLLLVCIAFACSQDDSKDSLGNNDKQQLVQFDVRSMSDLLKNNIDVYVFNGTGTVGFDYDYFNHKVLNIERTEELLKMRMPVGRWNLVLVGCSESNIRSKLTAPTILDDKSGILMWETEVEGGYLQDVPEIRTALLDEVDIFENQTTQKSATMERNVAKVRVVVVESYGLDASSTEHYVTLNKVPTALAWDGSFYPSLHNPRTSTAAMRKKMILSQDAGAPNGVLISDTVDFIIPAHKGSEETAHRMELGAYFTRTGGGFWPLDGNNTKEIEFFPKANQILLVNLTVKAGIEIEVKVEEWREVNVDYDLDELYTITEIEHDNDVSTVQMIMREERAWWVNLSDTDNFEFIEGNTAGQKTAGTLIKIKKKNAAAPVPSSLVLGISGLEGIDIEVPIFTL